MAIKTIKVSNFKSFQDLEVELSNLNVLIGANASGKSNFIQIFKFLRDIANHGLDNAISMQGGVEYLRNIRIGSSRNLSLKIVSDERSRGVARREKEKGLIGISTCETIYEFGIKFRERGAGFEIAEDKLTYKCDFIGLEQARKNKIKEKEKLGSGEIVLTNVGGRVKVSLGEGVPIGKGDIIPQFVEKQKLLPRTLLLEAPFLLSIFPPQQVFLGNFAIYDFDPRLPRKAIPITGKMELEDDASNLAIVLKNIIEAKEKKRKFSNLVKDLLPFVDDLDVDKFADKSLLFKLREIYARNLYLPAFLISDGTINITALIIVLYFEDKPLVIIEEPERNLHPYLISKVVNMMKDASSKKQVILTTHNPEMLRYAEMDSILLASRDKEGFSTISRPSEKETVKIFLQSEVGIEELYVQNLLGV